MLDERRVRPATWRRDVPVRLLTHPALGLHYRGASIASEEIQKLLGLGVSVMG